MLRREWFTAAELAGMSLPGLPASARGMQIALGRDWSDARFEGVRWRGREGRGGGVEYHYTALPAPAQAQIVSAFNDVAHAAERAGAQDRGAREDLWGWFDRLPERKKAEAHRRLEALDAAVAMSGARIGRTEAMKIVAHARGIGLSSLYAWASAVDAIQRHDWLPYLAPRHSGRAGHEVECAPEAWDFLKADYLRLERPTFEACFRRLERAAAQHG
ncbi:MAG: hypothetical protein KGL52_00605, partial [Rhodospirillales bacterium]|nr:hypothetical protein [Rhodospirillales bacterium]